MASGASGEDTEPSPDDASASAPAAAPKKRGKPPLSTRFKRRWRAWLRAINHIGEWDPNFAVETSSKTIDPLPESVRGDEEAATQAVLASLEIEAEPRDFFFETDEQLEIFFDENERTLVVNVVTGDVTESYKSERFFLRAANWLHYNRGKSAWTYIADGYAIFLLFLALSGIFMLKGRKGFIGRGAILIAIGAAIPILYVHFSGGP